MIRVQVKNKKRRGFGSGGFGNDKAQPRSHFQHTLQVLRTL